MPFAKFRKSDRGPASHRCVFCTSGGVVLCTSCTETLADATGARPAAPTVSKGAGVVRGANGLRVALRAKGEPQGRAPRTRSTPICCRRKGSVFAATGQPTQKSNHPVGPQMAKYSKKAQKKIEKTMHEFKHGELKSGRSGKKVRSRKQAIAIGISEARRMGGKVPRPKKKSAKKK